MLGGKGKSWHCQGRNCSPGEREWGKECPPHDSHRLTLNGNQKAREPQCYSLHGCQLWKHRKRGTRRRSRNRQLAHQMVTASGPKFLGGVSS